MADKRIGTLDRFGGVDTYPETSISGQVYEFPPTQVCKLDSGRFVVLDIFPPRDFDVQAALAELRTPVRAAKAKQEVVDEPENP